MEKYNEDFNYILGKIQPRAWGYEYLVTFEKKTTGEHFNHVLVFPKEPKDQVEIDKQLATLMTRILNEPVDIISDKIYTESEILEVLKAKNLIDVSINSVEDISTKVETK